MKYIFDIPDNVDYGVLTCRTSNGYYEYNFDGADLEKLPPAQPERIKGRWIIKNNTERFIAQCNCCRYIEDSRRIKNFCPNCGAEMEVAE